MIKTLFPAVAALLIAGCVKTEYIPLTAVCAPRPPLLSITATELQPLTETTYQKLVERELRLKEHIELLEIFCE